MDYSTRVDLSHLTANTWQKGQNAILVDYRKFKESGQEPSSMHRSWTFLANLTATIGWGILAVPASVLAIFRVKNISWQRACESGTYTKAAFYARNHFKPLMETFRSFEAQAYYRDCLNVKWDAGNTSWKEFSGLCSKLSPESFDNVWKKMVFCNERYDFLKNLVSYDMEKPLKANVLRYLYGAGWIVVKTEHGAPQFYPSAAIKEMPKKYPEYAPLVNRVVEAKGGEMLLVNQVEENKCGAFVKKYQAVQDVKQQYEMMPGMGELAAWNGWKDKLTQLTPSQLFKALDSIAIDYRKPKAVSAIHSALYSKLSVALAVQKLQIKASKGYPPEKIRTRIETFREKAFEAGYLTGVHYREFDKEGQKQRVVESTMYPVEIMTIIQDPTHPKSIKVIADAMLSKGKQAVELTEAEKNGCDNFVAGKLEGWTVKDPGGQVPNVVLTGLDKLVDGAQSKPVQKLLNQLFPELAKGIIDKTVTLTDADAAQLKAILARRPDADLNAALLLWDVRKATVATIDPFIDSIRDCPKLNTILLDLLETPVFLATNVPIPQRLADIKQFVGARVVNHPDVCKRERAIDVAAVAGVLSFDQMCDLIRRTTVTFAAWNQWLEYISRPLLLALNTPEEQARVAWKNNPEQVRKLQDAILLQMISTRDKFSLIWAPHLGRMWEQADDEGKLALLQILSETTWWQQLPWAGDLRAYAQTDLALKRQTKACNTILGYCMGHTRDPKGPDLSFADPLPMLVNALKWQLPKLRDACIEKVLGWDAYNVEFDLGNAEPQFITALGQVGAKLIREEVRPLEQLAKEALTLWQVSINADFGPAARSFELGKACRQYLTQHAADYREVLDRNAKPPRLDGIWFHGDTAKKVLMQEEWKKTCDFLEKALGRR